ncbi:MAG: hypothetical protein IPL78_00095 [Chloroflexi bacterium]|nr:hypothetical protein [Chloroflexota bacterium]
MMNTWLNRWQAIRGEWAFYRILRDWAAEQEGGSTVIAEFERDRRQGRSLLRHFLQTQLTDETARQELIEALENRHNRFVNVVTNSQVGKIVNIAEAGAVYWQVTVFSDVRQVVALVGMVVLIAAALGATIWYLNQPRKMTGDFNIAVAEFEQIGETDTDVAAAALVSQLLYNFLNDVYPDPDVVQVTHDRIGLIQEGEQARQLAERINADVVIYGTVSVLGDEVQVKPFFYVVAPYLSDIREINRQINGETQLTPSIQFLLAEIINPSLENTREMKERTRVLTEFTRALIYLALAEPNLAYEAIYLAIKAAEQQAPFPGEEIMYLYASHISLLQIEKGKKPEETCTVLPLESPLREEMTRAQAYLAQSLARNPTYGRAYIAKANIYLSFGEFAEAERYYQDAKMLPDQPFGSFVAEKAELGLGNSDRINFQCARRNATNLDATQEVVWANQALTHYQAVIDRYNEDKSKPDATLRELTSLAYYLQGVVYQEAGEVMTAFRATEYSLALTENPSFRSIVLVLQNEVRP